MLTKRNVAILGILFLIAAAIFWAFVYVTPSFHTCVNEAADTYRAQHPPTKEQPVTAVPMFLDYWPCAANTTHENGEAITAFSTALLAAITIGMVLLGLEQGETTRAQLRAYVKLSHLSPPGIDGLDGTGINHITGEVILAVEVRNSGHTPATVTDVFLNAFVVDKGDKLPAKPDYTGDRPPNDVTRNFLVANDRFIHYRQFFLKQADFDPIAKGKKILYVTGYVDYIDTFKRRYRGGYARVYDPVMDAAPMESRNNLAFVRNAGYNYDRLRPRGVGRDWKETDN